MMLSSGVLTAMGLIELTVENSVTAKFFGLSVYEAQGLLFDGPEVVQREGVVSGVTYRMVIGNSINALTQTLLQEDLFEDENEWSVLNKSAPPYIVIYIGPSAEYTAVAGFRSPASKALETYDTFELAREEIKNYQLKVLPALVTALSCHFGEIHDATQIKSLSQEVYGRSNDGEIFSDFTFKVSGAGRVLRKVEASAFADGFEKASRLASDVPFKISSFFQLALEEKDLLKRFLYFFLTIERQIHSTFKSIDVSAEVEKLTSSSGVRSSALSDFLASKSEAFSSPLDRFTFNFLTVWGALSDEDFSEFKRLKRVRDNLAHGEIAMPGALDVIAVEKLSKKILLC